MNAPSPHAEERQVPLAGQVKFFDWNRPQVGVDLSAVDRVAIEAYVQRRTLRAA